MSKQDQLRALRKGLADSVLSASDDELIEEVRDEGLDPDAVAEETRALLLKTVKDFKQRAIASSPCSATSCGDSQVRGPVAAPRMEATHSAAVQAPDVGEAGQPTSRKDVLAK